MSSERDAILDFANALEAAAVNLKHHLGAETHSNPTSGARIWDPSKIKWTEDVGKKGPYEKATDGAEDYKNLVKDLQDHQNKLSYDKQFYWLFSDGKAVGRTLKK